jgi:hypothetical protein
LFYKVNFTLCGDGIIQSGEECEIGGLGCDEDCICNSGYVPTVPATKDCIKLPICGDGILDVGEQCEIDGNGCSPNCICLPGFVPANPFAKVCFYKQ